MTIALFVTWSIEVDVRAEYADPFAAAAIKAAEIQQDPASIAAVFTVLNKSTGETRTVDLGSL